MKTAANISVILNLALLGTLLWIWTVQHRERTVSTPPAVAQTVSRAMVMAISAPPIFGRTEPQPFRWAQLESADYRTYVKNLRAIGCPQATLHAIVTADVDAVYRQRSRELEQKLDDIENSSWAVQLGAYHDQQALKTQLQKLPGEEYSEICDLLGLKTGPEQQVATAIISSAVRRRQDPAKNHTVMPLVLQPVDVSALKLNDQQIQAIYELRQQFMDEIGGPNQNPSDPAYQERWQKAQPEIDDNLRGMLGTAVFENYQVAAQDPESAVSRGVRP